MRNSVLAGAVLFAILAVLAPLQLGNRAAQAATNPFAGANWFIDPDSYPKQQADAWRVTRPDDAALLDYLAARPVADWFGGWLGDTATETWASARVGQIVAAGGLPVLVAYNIPNRDCGGYSQGGATDARQYASWIDRLARGIGNRKAIILLEPDSLTVTDCLTSATRQERYTMLRNATGRLKQNPNASVYLDAGANDRNSSGVIAGILTSAGIAQADGFFLNASVYQWTTSEVAFGREVSAHVGGKHFVVDTSRNGLGPGNGAWCNAPGRALGPDPTINTGEPLADAFIWVKPVWQSDGNCGRGEPGAGQFFWAYALGLVRKSFVPFNDLPADPDAAEAGRQLVLRGVIRGNADGTVSPAAQTLRAQMAALIARSMYWEREDHGATPFPDRNGVDNNLWRNVGTVAFYNVSKGYGDGTFNPLAPVLQQHVILFISRAMVARGYWVEQPDNPAYYPNLPGGTDRERSDRRDIVTYAYYTQPLGGIPDHPATGPFTAYDQPATREWFARALYRALVSAYLH